MGRPREEPIRDGVLPFGILELLYLANEAVEDLRQERYGSGELFGRPTLPFPTLCHALCDALVDHLECRDEVVLPTDAWLQPKRKL